MGPKKPRLTRRKKTKQAPKLSSIGANDGNGSNIETVDDNISVADSPKKSKIDDITSSDIVSNIYPEFIIVRSSFNQASVEFSVQSRGNQGDICHTGRK